MRISRADRSFLSKSFTCHLKNTFFWFFLIRFLPAAVMPVCSCGLCDKASQIEGGPGTKVVTWVTSAQLKVLHVTQLRCAPVWRSASGSASSQGLFIKAFKAFSLINLSSALHFSPDKPFLFVSPHDNQANFQLQWQHVPLTEPPRVT